MTGCLDPEIKKVLDIGCGLGFLIEYLRGLGIDAEGIDQDAPNKTYIIQQNCFSIHPDPGSIPRKDYTYDYILSHGVTPPILDLDSENSIIIPESLRVLKTNGEMIITPSFDITEKTLSSIRPGKYHIEKRDVWYWQEAEKYLDEIGRQHVDYSHLKYTTVVKKLS